MTNPPVWVEALLPKCDCQVCVHCGRHEETCAGEPIRKAMLIFLARVLVDRGICDQRTVDGHELLRWAESNQGSES